MMGEGVTAVEAVALLPVVLSAFVATNLDNLLILVGLLGAAPGQRAAVIVGYVAAAAAVLVAALLGGLAGSLIDPALVGYLGILPLVLGAWLLWRTVTGPGESAADAGDGAPGAGPGGSTRELAGPGLASPGLSSPGLASPGLASPGLSTFFLMASNSGDSIAVFLPLFAESSREALIMAVVVFLLMALFWALVAHWAVGRPAFAAVLRRSGRYLVPVIMMAVGVYILLDTASDTLL
jgi:cadmium resistance protein CadD (predicted permease)